jgi:hypothetical protein
MVAANPLVVTFRVCGPKFRYCLTPRSKVKAPFCKVGAEFPALSKNCVTPGLVVALKGALGTVKVA